MRSELLEVFRRRYACHQFDPARSISQDDLDYILESGRLSPSSFGLEQWKFMVVVSADLKMRLQDACFNQHQVGNASCDIVILAKIADLNPDSDYVKTLLARESPGAQLAGALKKYRDFHAGTDTATWSITQCHIAAANMMTAAMAVGIDSCAIGGFVADDVKRLLGIQPGRYEVALILSLGYCTEPPGEKLRLPTAELVEYR
jgi:nitroreductase